MHRLMAIAEPLLPGIPSAPKGKRFITAAEVDYQKRKLKLAHMLPALRPEDLVGTLVEPFYQTLLRDLMASGNSRVADEINNLLRKEERDRKSVRVKSRMPQIQLIDQPELLERIAETLKLEQTLLQEGKKESAMLTCKHLADSFLLQDKSIWLARHFYLAVLYRCRKICPDTTARLQSEIHCLLAYIARENNENLESALAIAIDHLAVCRTLSRDQNWQFKPNTVLVKLKKPIAFYGIVDDVYEVVDACTMSIYMIASLLKHELLISLANQIMHSPHHKAPTDDDLKNAHEFADLALQLALEVRQPVALSSALTRFGIVLRHVGAFEDAMSYFHQLQQHANIIGDIATEAIAYHNIGLCYIGMYNTVDALECFTVQRELATLIATKELQGNSMHEIGHLLLQEGHLWEAEECYLVAFECFYYAHQVRHTLTDHHRTSIDEDHGDSHAHTAHHENHHRTEIAWAMAGVSAGQKQWQRLACLSRSGQFKDLTSILQFKCNRKPLNAVGRPDYTVQHIADMERPWENPDMHMESRDITDEMQTSQTSESSWEEGFMFATNIKLKSSKASKKVGFDEDIVESNVVDQIDNTGRHQIDIEEAMRELKQMNYEAEQEKARADFHASRVSSLLEKDERMRKSMASTVSRRSSVAVVLMDRRPTVTIVASNDGDKDKENKED